MFVMQDLRFRILTLCVVPFLIGSGLVLLTAITSLQSQTEQAERQLAETLLVHKAPDAALYLATEDWVALAVILDQLTQATGLGRAEVLNRDNQLLLASGKAPALRAQYTAPLRHEGLLIGSLSLIVNQAPQAASIRFMLIQLLCVITAMTMALGLIAWKFGDFIFDRARSARTLQEHLGRDLFNQAHASTSRAFSGTQGNRRPASWQTDRAFTRGLRGPL